LDFEVEERETPRARRGLGAGLPFDFFAGTANLTMSKNIVTEQRDRVQEGP